LAKEVIPKGLILKWTLNLGSNCEGDNNIKNILIYMKNKQHDVTKEIK
jgi:hypothetical protein